MFFQQSIFSNSTGSSIFTTQFESRVPSMIAEFLPEGEIPLPLLSEVSELSVSYLARSSIGVV